MLYLSKIAVLEGLDFGSTPKSERSSLLAEFRPGVPPQRVWKASRPLIFIPMLLVLLNTAAITGKSSFLVVEKSRTGSIVGKVLRDTSMTECVGDSRA